MNEPVGLWQCRASVPLTATALIAAVDDARQFRSGRELSAWLGLVPRHYSSGERVMLLGISRRGDRFLRTLLIHGARTTLRHARRKRDWRSRWVVGLGERRGPNIAAVALANKNARVQWSLLTPGEEYRIPVSARPRKRTCQEVAAKVVRYAEDPEAAAIAEGIGHEVE
jgi:hypothetical protein